MSKINIIDRKKAIDTLEHSGQAIIKCNGNSMTNIMYPGNALYLRKVEQSKLRVGDAVFCRIRGALQVHKITRIDSKTHYYEIGNNHGFINGWIGSKSIYGLCVRVEDTIRVSDKELAER